MSDHPKSNTSSRKDEHIRLAKESILEVALNDKRFDYEPLFGRSPKS